MSSSLYKQLGLSGATGPALTGRHLALLLLAAVFLVLTIFVVHPNEFRIQSFFSGSTTTSSSCDRPGPATTVTSSSSSTSTTSTTEKKSPDTEAVRVLIGIQTLPSKRARRHMLRDIYSLQQSQEQHPSTSTSTVDIRFVFCNVTSPTDAVLIAVESSLYNDIMILNCTENMDNGKTYTFFSTVSRTTFPKNTYDYVMKADDDTYLRLPSLLSSLRDASREDAYYGLQMPCDAENFYPFPPFMSGMGYALSWDLVEWVGESELARKEQDGPEDMWTGRWFNLAGKAKNRYDMGARMYNYKGDSPDTCFRHGFVPDTVAVHMLKDDKRWAETLAYFNATAGVGLHHGLPPLPAAASSP